jgi:uncharacterized protein YjbI with pentapeptide repeats
MGLSFNNLCATKFQNKIYHFQDFLKTDKNRVTATLMNLRGPYAKWAMTISDHQYSVVTFSSCNFSSESSVVKIEIKIVHDP